MARRLGVCSWSLKPSSPRELADKTRAAGLSAVQLALDPIREKRWGSPRAARLALDRAGIRILSGMMAMRGEDYSTLDAIKNTGGVRLDANWPANRLAAEENARIARALGIRFVTFHAGFISHDDSDPMRRVMLERLRVVIDIFAAHNIATAFETGQESADTLLPTLADLQRPHLGVNFDPANMLLYGMGDPVESARKLARRIRQVHIKDADPSPTPGKWGTEKPAGTGSVPWPAFFAVLRASNVHCNFIIEREGGDDRLGDVIRARALVQSLTPGIS